MASLTVENYVKAIYAIASGRPPGGEAVATGELASALGVAPGTVTGMLKGLSEAGLASYVPYEGALLTDRGRVLALKVLRRHRLIELFLSRTLNMPWDEVHEEAEHLEHVVSDRLVDRIDAHLGRPSVDPHGDPIPKADGTVQEPTGAPLTLAPTGAMFQVTRVLEQDPAFLRYLSEQGLDLGKFGTVLDNRPEAGALVVQAAGRPVALGTGTAAKVWVAIAKEGDSPT